MYPRASSSLSGSSSSLVSLRRSRGAGVEGTPRKFLTSSNFVEDLCWLFLCVAFRVNPTRKQGQHGELTRCKRLPLLKDVREEELVSGPRLNV